MAIRGSPAKGVVLDEGSVGSNPTFSAKNKGRDNPPFILASERDLNGLGSE